MVLLILVALVGLGVLALGWWLSRPMQWFWRWTYRVWMLVMVVGLSLPWAAIDWIRDNLSLLIPLAREVTDAPGINIWAHFLLFSIVSGLLFWFRRDLSRRLLLAIMIGLAFVMEAVQLLVNDRYASWMDVGVNLVGVAVGAGIGLLGRWIDRPGARPDDR